MRKLLILFGFALLATSIAQAQETRGMEVSGQYQYVRVYPGQGAPSANCQGAGGTFAANVNRWVGVVGDVGEVDDRPVVAGKLDDEIGEAAGAAEGYEDRLDRALR